MLKCIFILLTLVYAAKAQSSRITNGEMAARHQFPWQAAIYGNTGAGTGFCGGSLIDERWVMTAAHCVDGFFGFRVVLGAHHLTNASEDSRQSFEIEEDASFIHPDWNRLLLQNDIALLKLPKAVVVNDFVKPIKVTNGSKAIEEARELATVSGWGLISDSASTISEYLQYITQPIISNMRCSIRYFGVIQQTHICISGRKGMSTCNGDSGGPLIVYDGDVPKQIGIVSFGIMLGCEVGWPPVFTRVSHFIDYIEDTTGINIK